MIYAEFADLRIENRLGVSPVGQDTLMIARNVARLPAVRSLEIGAGTGFVSLYLAARGGECLGTDISPDAVDCCRHNAAKNNLDVEFIRSDLFATVKGRYDLIIFNPPYGHAGSGILSRPLDIIKSVLPKENQWLSAVVYQFIRKERRQMISEFLAGAINYLDAGGSVVLVLRFNELDLLDGGSMTVLDELNQQKLVRWQPGGSPGTPVD